MRRRGGEEAQRRRALWEVLPLPPDGRDLHDVVHHRDRREPDLLGGAGDGAEAGRELGGATWPGPPADLEAEAHGHGTLLLAPGGGRGVVQRARHDRDVAVTGAVDGVEAVVVDGRHGGGERLELLAHDARRHGFGSGPVAGSGVPRRACRPARRGTPPRLPRRACGSGGGSARRARSSRRRSAARGAGAWRRSARGPRRVIARPQVVAVVADDGAQVVPRHDGGGREPPPGPGGLPGPGDADHDHQARLGEADGHERARYAGAPIESSSGARRWLLPRSDVDSCSPRSERALSLAHPLVKIIA